MTKSKYPQSTLSITTHAWLTSKFKLMASKSEFNKLSPFMTKFLIEALENNKRIEQLEKELATLKGGL